MAPVRRASLAARVSSKQISFHTAFGPQPTPSSLPGVATGPETASSGAVRPADLRDASGLCRFRPETRPSSDPNEGSSSPASASSDPVSPLGSCGGVMKPLCDMLKFSHSLSIKSIASPATFGKKSVVGVHGHQPGGRGAWTLGSVVGVHGHWARWSGCMATDRWRVEQRGRFSSFVNSIRGTTKAPRSPVSKPRRCVGVNTPVVLPITPVVLRITPVVQPITPVVLPITP
eukprot:3259483-Prymnesium_polylepis.1